MSFSKTILLSDTTKMYSSMISSCHWTLFQVLPLASFEVEIFFYFRKRILCLWIIGLFPKFKSTSDPALLLQSSLYRKPAARWIPRCQGVLYVRETASHTRRRCPSLAIYVLLRIRTSELTRAEQECCIMTD